MRNSESKKPYTFKHLIFGKEYTVTVYFDDNRYNANFCFKNRILEIPAFNYYDYLVHELMEMGFVLNLCRFVGCEGSQEFHFMFNHSQFSTVIEIVAPEIKRLDEYLRSRFKVNNGNLIRKRNAKSKTTVKL